MNPHTCPVCRGMKQIQNPNPFSHTAASLVISCPACYGRGIVWEPPANMPGELADAMRWFIRGDFMPKQNDEQVGTPHINLDLVGVGGHVTAAACEADLERLDKLAEKLPPEGRRAARSILVARMLVQLGLDKLALMLIERELADFGPEGVNIPDGAKAAIDWLRTATPSADALFIMAESFLDAVKAQKAAEAKAEEEKEEGAEQSPTGMSTLLSADLLAALQAVPRGVSNPFDWWVRTVEGVVGIDEAGHAVSWLITNGFLVDSGRLHTGLAGETLMFKLREDAIRPWTEPRSLDVTSSKDFPEKVSDVVVFGDPDLWRLVCKASSKSQGWMTSTKAMALPSGVLIQVSTQQGEHVAEALAFVPCVYQEQTMAALGVGPKPPDPPTGDPREEANKMKEEANEGEILADGEDPHLGTLAGDVFGLGKP